MILIFYLISILILLYLWVVYHDYMHPAFITQCVWVVLISIYNWYISVYKIWTGLSDKFYLVIILYTMFFFISSCIFSRVKIPMQSVKTVHFTMKHTLLLDIVIIFLCVLSIYYLKIIFTAGFSLVREETDFGDNLPVYINIASYSYPLGMSLFFLGMDDSSFRKKNKVKLLVLFALIMVVSFTSTNKGGLIQLAICILFFLKLNGKLSIRNLIFIIVSFVFIVFILQMLRSGEEADKENFLQRFLYVYILSPLPAFDAVITGQKILDTGFFGGWSLSFFYRLFNKIGLLEVIPSTLFREEKWIGVPYATNVYTMPGYFFIDFGIIGIIVCAFLYGFVFGKLYLKMHFNEDLGSKLFYGFFIYVLIFQFFGDWFFGFFSVTVQYAFWIFILVHTFKFE